MIDETKPEPEPIEPILMESRKFLLMMVKPGATLHCLLSGGKGRPHEVLIFIISKSYPVRIDRIISGHLSMEFNKEMDRMIIPETSTDSPAEYVTNALSEDLYGLDVIGSNII